MEGKQAYLIMAHHRFDILKEILSDLDDERNVIFLHVDIKAKDYNQIEITNVVKKAQIFFTKRMNIHWGGYSQIECVINLLKEAISTGFHTYYHFMVGVEFLLKSQNYIYDFFQKNAGYEFIGFDNYDTQYLERVRYYHPFNEYARNNNYLQKILNKLRITMVRLQKFLNVDISRKYGIKFKKGNANWSITHALAQYIVDNEKQIHKIYKHSFCGDEIFIHTLVYNSSFWKNVYDKEDENHSSMRITTWEDRFNQYHTKDIDILLNSGKFFARKIDGQDAMELILMIKNRRNEEFHENY